MPSVNIGENINALSTWDNITTVSDILVSSPTYFINDTTNLSITPDNIIYYNYDGTIAKKYSIDDMIDTNKDSNQPFTTEQLNISLDEMFDGLTKENKNKISEGK